MEMIIGSKEIGAENKLMDILRTIRDAKEYQDLVRKHGLNACIFALAFAIRQTTDLRVFAMAGRYSDSTTVSPIPYSWLTFGGKVIDFNNIKIIAVDTVDNYICNIYYKVIYEHILEDMCSLIKKRIA